MSIKQEMEDIDTIEKLREKYPTLSVPFLQMKLKVEYGRAKEIYDLWMKRKRK
jgi:hypothetical protein